MSKTAEDYQLELLALPAPGLAFSREPASNWGKLMLAFGDGLARADAKGEQLLAEGDPRTTSDMLDDWEEALGLPDSCTGPVVDVNQRRALAFERHSGQGGQSKGFFVDLAATLGYPITITPHSARRYGRALCGTAYAGWQWDYVWDVHAPPVNVFPRTYGGARLGTPYSSFGNEPLQCEIGKFAPAETLVRFLFDGG
jgi:uncharacterized protein YmfQ (DUF2313 family)